MLLPHFGSELLELAVVLEKREKKQGPVRTVSVDGKRKIVRVKYERIRDSHQAVA